jgi:Secretion system C-terminal sorting domain
LGWLHDTIAIGGGTKHAAPHITDFYEELDSIIAWWNRGDIPSNDTNLIHIGLPEENINNKLDIKLYPNPNNGSFYLEHGNKDICYQIFDVNGRLLKEEENISTLCIVDISTFTDGLYFVRCYNSENQKFFKIIKQ